MSNVEMESSDEEYHPSARTKRKSCPTKKLAFSTKSIPENNPFMGECPSSPKKQEKRSPKAKPEVGSAKWNTGRWTKEEHTKFLEAIKIHGRDWKKVQDYVGTRTSTQARSHAQKVLPHPSSTEGINQSHNSTSTTLTKGSPQSQKNFPNPE